MLKSTDVLTKVVLKTGLQKLEMAEDQSTGETSPLTLEKALWRLRNSLLITPLKRSNILRVSYSGFTPELANAVLRALADTYPERRMEVHSRPATVTFLRRQSMAWQVTLRKAEEDLVRCRRMYSGFVFPEERAAFAKRAVEAQTAAEQADAQVAEYAHRAHKEREQLAQFRPKAVSYSRRNGKPYLAAAEYHSQLINESDLSALQKDLLVSQAELSALEGLRDRLKQVADRYRKERFQLASAAIEHDSLLRQVKQSEVFYLLYSKKQEDTRIREALAHGHIANVSLADGPTMPVEPSSPRVMQDLLIALLCSLGCGVAVVFIVELLTPGHIRTYAALRSLSTGAY